ncbi:MAG: helix-hairpin-helix domain-containing protein [Anaerolineae bacterium]
MGAFLERNRRAIYGVLLILTIAGVYALYVRAPHPEPIQIIEPTPVPAANLATPSLEVQSVLVHVVGEVQVPGVYTLPGDARVVDAVTAAGGLTTLADPEMINLADRVSDGQQVRVPGLGAEPQPSLTPYPASQGQRSGSLGVLSSGALININTATASELETLPGIGAVLAGRIVAYRTENGPFQAIEGVMDVRGIGESYYAQIRDLITVQ